MIFAIQILTVSRPASFRHWKTVGVEKRYSDAERALTAIRQNRKAVAAMSRIKPIKAEIAS